MDFTFLADRIKTHLLELQPDDKPLCVIRGSGGFNDEPGESYIIPYSDVIYLYNRKFSDPDFEVQSVALADISQLLLNQEAFCAVLSINAGDVVNLKISSAEIPNAELMLENFESCREIKEQFTETVPQDVAEGQQISPLLGLAVILMFVATVDDDIADEEQEFIKRFCDFDNELYDKAYDYYRKHTFEDTIGALALNGQQKMCYLANIIELAMVDGVFDSREQKMIRRFSNAADLTESEVRTIRDVLLMKNQLSVL
ncbi:MAG: TerB family tellurite resistance protein [Victivallaceae bacterium]|nr:TerB family tellurite resistance protein [Victivallaceae bacterium]